MTQTDLVEPKPRLGRKRDHTRDPEILDAALDVLAETGYDGMTIDMVAARAKAGKATALPPMGVQVGARPRRGRLHEVDRRRPRLTSRHRHPARRPRRDGQDADDPRERAQAQGHGRASCR